MKKGIYINDSIHGLIQLSEYEKRIISSVGFNRLHDVYQNSTAYLTFPSNRTKRFEHSLGTMKLCSDMFYHSILNSDTKMLEQFFNEFEEAFKGILEDIASDSFFCEKQLNGTTPNGVLPKIDIDEFKRTLIPFNVPEKYSQIYYLLIESVRVAALLHDIGHPPFSHVVEHALKNVYEKVSQKKPEALTEREKEFCDTLKEYAGNSRKLHESMGDQITKDILCGIIGKANDHESEYDELLFEALIYNSVPKVFANDSIFSLLHKVIDAELDGDRLDYVTRDALNSGMNSGKIEYARIINEMRLMKQENDYYFCVPIKAVNSVEDFVKRRFNIYREIVYHHRVIKTDCLLEKTIEKLVLKDIERTDDSTTSSDKTNSFVEDFQIISGLWAPLKKGTITEKKNILSLWNDSWLITILKQIYYSEYYSMNKTENDYYLKQMLEELLNNEKNYYSIIKRGESFRLVDNGAKEQIAKNSDKIQKLVKQVDDLSLKLGEKEKSDQFDIQGSLDCIKKILDLAGVSNTTFLISFYMKNMMAFSVDEETFKKEIYSIVAREEKTIFHNTEHGESLVVFKTYPNIGTIYFYEPDDSITTLNDISGVSDSLILYSDYLPVFYIFFPIEKGDLHVYNNRTDFLNSIGKSIGDNIVQTIIGFLTKIREGMKNV